MKLIQGDDLSDRVNQNHRVSHQVLSLLLKHFVEFLSKSTGNVEIHLLYTNITDDIIDDDFILVFSSIMYVELGLEISKLCLSNFFLALSVISDRYFTVKVNKVHLIVAETG